MYLYTPGSLSTPRLPENRSGGLTIYLTPVDAPEYVGIAVSSNSERRWAGGTPVASRGGAARAVPGPQSTLTSISIFLRLVAGSLTPRNLKSALGSPVVADSIIGGSGHISDGRRSSFVLAVTCRRDSRGVISPGRPSVLSGCYSEPLWEYSSSSRDGGIFSYPFVGCKRLALRDCNN